MGYPYPNFCLCAFLGPYLRELGRLRLKVLIAVCMLLLLPVGAASLQALQGLRTWGSSRLFIVWKFRGFRVLGLGFGVVGV